ncbi:hypothetical protein SCACP_38430 [Sporomusa carbonis]|uniref:helix-turn-helix transcriptional regulator n=1 Tax=Sporomusa carbonis TaxID=3076075 RepID=UPI003A620E19
MGLKNIIVKTRKIKKITQQELAKIGIKRPYLSDIENCKYQPGGELMLNIAKALNVAVEEIFFVKIFFVKIMYNILYKIILLIQTQST